MKVLVRHRLNGQRYDRESVMVWLGSNGREMKFSARPVAGTQTFPVEAVLDVQKVADETDVYVNARAD